MREVIKRVLIVISNIFVSSFGICRFIVGLFWLCMHIMDVSDGSMYW